MLEITPIHIPELAAMIAQHLTLDDLEKCLLVCSAWRGAFGPLTGHRIKLGHLTTTELCKRLETAHYSNSRIRSLEFSWPRDAPDIIAPCKDLILYVCKRFLTRLCLRLQKSIDEPFARTLLQQSPNLKELIWHPGNSHDNDSGASLLLSLVSCDDGGRSRGLPNLISLDSEWEGHMRLDILLNIGRVLPKLQRLVLCKGIIGLLTTPSEEILKSSNTTPTPAFPALEDLKVGCESSAQAVVVLLRQTPSLIRAELGIHCFYRDAAVDGNSPVVQALVDERCCPFLKSLTFVGRSAATGAEKNVVNTVTSLASLLLEDISLINLHTGSTTVSTILKNHAVSLRSLTMTDSHTISNKAIHDLLSGCPMLETLTIRPQSIGAGGKLIDVSKMVSPSSKPWCCSRLRILHAPFHIPLIEEYDPVDVMSTTTAVDCALKERTDEDSKDRDGQADELLSSLSPPEHRPKKRVSGAALRPKPTLTEFFSRLNGLENLQAIAFYFNQDEANDDDQRTERLKNRLPTTCEIEVLNWSKKKRRHTFRGYRRPSSFGYRYWSSRFY